MVTINIDIQDMLINGQVGEIAEFEIMNLIMILPAGNAMLSDYFAQQNCKGSISPIIKRIQFPLMLSSTCTIHEVQGLSLKEGVVDFDLQKQRTFGQGQMYTELSRVSSYDKLFCMGKFKLSSIKVNVSALQEYEQLRQNSIFENI